MTRVARIVQCKPCREAVAKQVRGEGVDTRPREGFLQADRAVFRLRKGGKPHVEACGGGDASAMHKNYPKIGDPIALAVGIDRLDPMDMDLSWEAVQIGIGHQLGLELQQVVTGLNAG